MTWKQLCLSFKHRRVVQRHRGWKATLQRCALFDFRGLPDDDLTEDFGDGIDASMLSPLPFPEVALVHDWQLMVLRDFVVSDDFDVFSGEMLGLAIPFPEHRRNYWEIVTGSVTMDFRKDAPPSEPRCPNSRTYLLDETPYDYQALVDQGITKLDKRSDDSDIISGLFANALKFLFYLNIPTRFMVCESPKKVVRPKKNGIARIGQRPRHIVLDKAAIAKRYLDSQPSDRRSPMPHLRRGHYRTLTSQRFRAKKGQRVWVRATHVAGNTVQWREGDRFYKVI